MPPAFFDLACGGVALSDQLISRLAAITLIAIPNMTIYAFLDPSCSHWRRFLLWRPDFRKKRELDRPNQLDDARQRRGRLRPVGGRSNLPLLVVGRRIPIADVADSANRRGHVVAEPLLAVSARCPDRRRLRPAPDEQWSRAMVVASAILFQIGLWTLTQSDFGRRKQSHYEEFQFAERFLAEKTAALHRPPTVYVSASMLGVCWLDWRHNPFTNSTKPPASSSIVQPRSKRAAVHSS